MLKCNRWGKGGGGGGGGGGGAFHPADDTICASFKGVFPTKLCTEM